MRQGPKCVRVDPCDVAKSTKALVRALQQCRYFGAEKKVKAGVFRDPDHLCEMAEAPIGICFMVTPRSNVASTK